MYKPGDHWVYCDRSGRKVRRSECKMTWDGLLVHKDYWEPRQPQDLVRGKADKIAVDNPRSEPDENYLTTNEVTADSL